MRFFGLAYLKQQFGSLQIKHPVVVVDKIAHKFILDNDFFVQYQCDILNSDNVIVFEKKWMPYTHFCLIITLICIFIYQSRTEIEPYEEAVIPGLLDFYRHYNRNQTLLLKPRKTELMQPLVAARVVFNFTSEVIPIFVLNICAERVTILKGKVLADDIALKARRVDLQELSTPPNCVVLVSSTNAGSVPSPDPVAEAIQTQTSHWCLRSVCLLSACSENTPVLLQPAPQTWGAPA